MLKIVMFLSMFAVGVVHAQYTTNKVTLPANAPFFVVDEGRQRVFVSQPSLNRVSERDLSTLVEVRSLPTGFGPTGLALSPDGRTLYSALNGAGAVAATDLDTGQTIEYVIGLLLGDARTFDVVADGTNVFVSSSPYSNGFAWIVKIDTVTGAAKRVASDRIIRAMPIFEIDRPNRRLYVGESFSPESLYVLDLANADAPIVTEDVHGSVFGTWRSLSLNPTGTRIVTGSAQLLRSQDLSQAALLAGGISEFSADGSEIIVAQPTLRFRRYNANTYDVLGDIETPCAELPFDGKLEALPSGRGLVRVVGTTLCVVIDADRLSRDGFE